MTSSRHLENLFFVEGLGVILPPCQHYTCFHHIERKFFQSTTCIFSCMTVALSSFCCYMTTCICQCWVHYPADFKISCSCFVSMSVRQKCLDKGKFRMNSCLVADTNGLKTSLHHLPHRPLNTLRASVRDIPTWNSGIEYLFLRYFPITVQLYNSQGDCARELFKHSKDAASLIDSNEKNWKVLDLRFFVGDISGIGFGLLFWLRLPGVGCNH